MKTQDLKQFVSRMTLEEKAGLCSGADNNHTKAVERLGIPSICLSDGPHGLRKQEEAKDYSGANPSKPAICFPAACASAASFDRGLLYEIGESLGALCQAEDVQALLGPALNIKRSPLCGRNFEYFSEDPYVAAELATAYVKGLQSRNVAASAKHFFANNQEYLRRTSSSNADDRTLREIYLAAFEGVVKNAKPWTLMSAYNKINGTFVSHSPKYLSDVLREEWGFDGMVVSDWTAVHDRAAAIEAGCDLTMPAEQTDGDIVRAVRAGKLKESDVDLCCERILNLVFRTLEKKKTNARYDFEAGHALARRAEEESIVLLKNENGVLPLKRSDNIVFIGKFAKVPRYQGGGSSRVNCTRLLSAMDSVNDYPNITYCQGFETNTNAVDEGLKSEALKAAAAADAAVIFAGLPDNVESEGYDRWSMALPLCQNDLIEAVCAVQPNTVVLLHNGSPVEMPWIEKVKGVLELYLGGQAVGEASVNVLFGKTNPSGRLPETFPKKLEDNPSFLFFPGEGNTVEYREGVFVGYRYYTTKKADVMFPFGYGLSYTGFTYSNLKVDRTKMTAKDTLHASVDVTNTGTRAGKEVTQLYVGTDSVKIRRPMRELRGFEKVELAPGETKRVDFVLGKRAFSYWDMTVGAWRVPGGKYKIQIGKSANEIVLQTEIQMGNEYLADKHDYSMMTSIGEIAENPVGKAFIDKVMPQFNAFVRKSGFVQGDFDKVMKNVDEHAQAQGLYAQPLQILKRFLTGYTDEDWKKFLNELNAPVK